MELQQPAMVVPGDSPRAQVAELAIGYPELYEAVDPERLDQWVDELGHRMHVERDFGTSGRGVPYLDAQGRNPSARAVGINRLVGMILDALQGINRKPLMVDLLGGDGLVSRVCTGLDLAGLSILTCDLSPYMVAEAWKKGVQALLQRAEQPLLKSASVDAVLLAYGSHHIPPEARQTAVSEAYRVLRPGGVFLLHDFDRGSATETWFRDVVDPYSSTGHQFQHYSPSEISAYLATAGFEHQEVLEVADPYVATGSDPGEAAFNVGDYLVCMYGLAKAEAEFGRREARFWAAKRAQAIFLGADDGRHQETGLRHDAAAPVWTMEIPRRAVVGLGLKGPARENAEGESR